MEDASTRPLRQDGSKEQRKEQKRKRTESLQSVNTMKDLPIIPDGSPELTNVASLTSGRDSIVFPTEPFGNMVARGTTANGSTNEGVANASQEPSKPLKSHRRTSIDESTRHTRTPSAPSTSTTAMASSSARHAAAPTSSTSRHARPASREGQRTESREGKRSESKERPRATGHERTSSRTHEPTTSSSKTHERSSSRPYERTTSSTRRDPSQTRGGSTSGGETHHTRQISAPTVVRPSTNLHTRGNTSTSTNPSTTRPTRRSHDEPGSSIEGARPSTRADASGRRPESRTRTHRPSQDGRPSLDNVSTSVSRPAVSVSTRTHRTSNDLPRSARPSQDGRSPVEKTLSSTSPTTAQAVSVILSSLEPRDRSIVHPGITPLKEDDSPPPLLASDLERNTSLTAADTSRRGRSSEEGERTFQRAAGIAALGGAPSASRTSLDQELGRSSTEQQRSTRPSLEGARQTRPSLEDARPSVEGTRPLVGRPVAAATAVGSPAAGASRASAERPRPPVPKGWVRPPQEQQRVASPIPAIVDPISTTPTVLSDSTGGIKVHKPRVERGEGKGAHSRTSSSQPSTSHTRTPSNTHKAASKLDATALTAAGAALLPPTIRAINSTSATASPAPSASAAESNSPAMRHDRSNNPWTPKKRTTPLPASTPPPTTPLPPLPGPSTFHAISASDGSDGQSPKPRLPLPSSKTSLPLLPLVSKTKPKEKRGSAIRFAPGTNPALPTPSTGATLVGSSTPMDAKEKAKEKGSHSRTPSEQRPLLSADGKRSFDAPSRPTLDQIRKFSSENTPFDELPSFMPTSPLASKPPPSEEKKEFLRSMRTRRLRILLISGIIIGLLIVALVLLLTIVRPKVRGAIGELGTGGPNGTQQACLDNFRSSAPTNPLRYDADTCLPLLRDITQGYLDSHPQDATDIAKAIQFCALRKVYDATGTGGSSALGSQGWFANADPCNPGWGSLQCDNNGRVTSLTLQPLATLSSFPSALSTLSSLQLLNITGAGSQPSGQINYLPSGLTRFELYQTGVNGWNGGFGNLKQVILDGNAALGPLPDGLLGQGLDTLVARNQNLTSGLDTIFTSSSFADTLQTLDLSHNAFSGQIPLPYLPHLTAINLSNNNLNNLPAELTFPPTLTNLDLSNNPNLNGTLGTALCNNLPLTACSFVGTLFSGRNLTCSVCRFN